MEIKPKSKRGGFRAGAGRKSNAQKIWEKEQASIIVNENQSQEDEGLKDASCQESSRRITTEHGAETESFESRREGSQQQLGEVRQSIEQNPSQVFEPGKLGSGRIHGATHRASLEDSQQVFPKCGTGNGEPNGEPIPPTDTADLSAPTTAQSESKRDSVSRRTASATGATGATPINSDDLRKLWPLYNPCNYIGAVRAKSGKPPLVDWQRKFVGDCEVVRIVADDAGVDRPTLVATDWPRNVLLAAVNGSGKTELIGELLFYFLSTVPGCIIPITSSVYRQLEMLESYLRSNLHLHPGFTIIEGKLTHASGNYARWFATDSEGSVESFHAPFLIRILDEVKSMADGIVDATNRWQPKLSIWVSSKGLQTGRFWKNATENLGFWRVHEVDASMCPWISPVWIDQMIKEHGRESPLIKSMILNQWNDADLKNLISYESVNDLIRHPPQKQEDGIVVAALDVSAAKRDGDECVLFHRNGNVVGEPWSCPPSENEMEVVGRVMMRIREVKPRFLFIDAGGAGAVVAARIAEVIEAEAGRCKVIRINFGKPLAGNPKFARKNGEMYGHACKQIVDRKLVLPNCQKLINQLVTREYSVNSAGQISLKSKKECGKSPDYADSFVMCVQETPEEFETAKTLSRMFKDDRLELTGSRTNGRYGMIGKINLGRF